MIVWACANQKGGVGKTTSTVALGGLLSERGKRVLLVDFDPHTSLTSYFGLDSDNMEHTCFDLFEAEVNKDNRQPMRHAIVRTPFDKLDLLPGSLALATLDKNLSKLGGMGLVLKRNLAQVADDYDYAIIDCPPIVGILMINALASCQHLIIPVQTEFLALKGLERMVRTIQMVIKAQHHQLAYTILPTMYDRRTKASVQSLRTLKKTYEDKLWQSCIPIDTRFRDASKEATPPSRFDPKGKGVNAYDRFLRFLLDPKNFKLEESEKEDLNENPEYEK